MTAEPTITELAMGRLRELIAASDDRVAIQAVRVALAVAEPGEADEGGPGVVSLAGLTAPERREVLRALTATDDVAIRELPRRGRPAVGGDDDEEA